MIHNAAQDGFIDRGLCPMEKEDSEEKQKRQEKVHGDTGKDDYHSGPQGFCMKAIFHVFLARLHAGNTVKSPKRQGPQRIDRALFLGLIKFGTKANGKFIDLHPDKFSRRKMAQFMHCDEHAKDNKRGKKGRHLDLPHGGQKGAGHFPRFTICFHDCFIG